MQKELQKEKVIRLYKKHGSKRKVAQILRVSRQYVIQEVQAYEAINGSIKVETNQ